MDLPDNLFDGLVEVKDRFLQLRQLFADQVIVNFLAHRFLQRMRYQEYGFRNKAVVCRCIVLTHLFRPNKKVPEPFHARVPISGNYETAGP